MREALFKKQNLDKWQSFEEDVQNIHSDKLAERFIELTDDLAYAQTFYPNSTTTRYLNELTAQFYRKIYANKKESSNRFVEFWKFEVPYLLFRFRKELWVAFCITFISAVIGAISVAYDDTFARLILGDDYIDMTLENIRKGDPLAVYGGSDPLMMFLQITSNNIKVSFVCFVMGCLFSAGTAYMLITNGIMLGVFQYFCYQQGFLKVSLLTIWLHGVLEISSIIVAGCAGLVMGNSLLFPQTYSRLESFKIGAKNGIKIVIALVPLFIMAGFIESFITRQHLNTFYSLLIIVPSFMFIVWYFIVYPQKVFQKSQLC
ncbi:stage II sporulation protein M [Flectobacillus longus]|uniref:stage II sporulation protein M n=1 Tax=Flectobacillus longus TaxID=2984207 RepID=UPI0024B80AA1|nr:stage II sporulation protein M [Flectobacillus longus]MDI9878830.1 stage II sporulation protein M [Flectobacillus longus]